jgi:hypothetical protein
VISEAEARRLPGWKFSDLSYANEKVFSELGEHERSGDCKSFMNRYERLRRSIEKMTSLLSAGEDPSPVNADGDPWFMEKSEQEDILREYIKIFYEFKPRYVVCYRAIKSLGG